MPPVALAPNVLLQSVCAMYIDKSVAMPVLPSLAFMKSECFLKNLTSFFFSFFFAPLCKGLSVFVFIATVNEFVQYLFFFFFWIHPFFLRL